MGKPIARDIVQPLLDEPGEYEDEEEREEEMVA